MATAAIDGPLPDEAEVGRVSDAELDSEDAVAPQPGVAVARRQRLGVLHEAAPGLEHEERVEPVDDRVGRLRRDTEARGELAHRHERASSGGHQQHPAPQRHRPRPAPLRRVRALTARRDHGLPDTARVQFSERSRPARPRRRDHTRRDKVTSPMTGSRPTLPGMRRRECRRD